MTVDISSLNNNSFNELHASLYLTSANVVDTAGTYVASPNAIGLAIYDKWLGTIASPDPSDTVSLNTQVSNAALSIITYTETSAGGVVSPATGGIGAEVLGWNATGVLLEQLTGYVPGTNPIITPTGQYFILTDPTVPLSFADPYSPGYPGPTVAQLTFSQTGPFPSLVPEPSTAMLMPLMVVALMVSRIPAVRAFLRTR